MDKKKEHISTLSTTSKIPLGSAVLRSSFFTAGAFTILPLEELVVLLGGKPPQFLFNRRGADA
jgi:hypothetical protein